MTRTASPELIVIPLTVATVGEAVTLDRLVAYTRRIVVSGVVELPT